MQVTQETGEAFFIVFMCITLFSVVWMPVTWLLLSIFTPKKLLDKYFKEPHFTLMETVFMARFPGFLMRTSMFGWALFFPKLGHKKRKIYDAGKYMPRWYRICLKIFVVGVSLFLFLFTSLMAIMFTFEPIVT